jgi:hypothetical protein
MTGLLIFTGVILVILNVFAIKKQDKSFNGALGNAIENLSDYDIKLGEIRREFSESIVDIQRELMDIRVAMEKSVIQVEDTDRVNDGVKKIYDENERDIVIDDFYRSEDKGTNNSTDISSNNSHTEKVQEIIRLFGEERSAEEISEILQLGKGEVLLIKDLYIR